MSSPDWDLYRDLLQMLDPDHESRQEAVIALIKSKLDERLHHLLDDEPLRSLLTSGDSTHQSIGALYLDSTYALLKLGDFIPSIIEAELKKHLQPGGLLNQGDHHAS